MGMNASLLQKASPSFIRVNANSNALARVGNYQPRCVAKAQAISRIPAPSVPVVARQKTAIK
jgi:hypothetical protein